MYFFANKLYEEKIVKKTIKKNSTYNKKNINKKFVFEFIYKIKTHNK